MIKNRSKIIEVIDEAEKAMQSVTNRRVTNEEFTSKMMFANYRLLLAITGLIFNSLDGEESLQYSPDTRKGANPDDC